MTTPITMTLAECARGGFRARLGEALGSGACVTISCAGAARLPAAFLCVACDLAVQHPERVRLDGLGNDARLAVEAIDEIGRIVIVGSARAAPARGIPPWAVSLDELGSVRLVALKGIGQHPQLGDAVAHQWMRGLAATAVTIDLAVVEHVNSLLVAWLLQLSQDAAPVRVVLVNVSRQASIQFTQLRLDHLLTWARDGESASARPAI